MFKHLNKRILGKDESQSSNSLRPLKRRAAKTFATALLILTLIITQTACASNSNSQENAGVSKTSFHLDTICTITIYGIADSDGSLAAMTDEELNKDILQLITDAFKLCDTYEKLLSKTIDDSDIAKINAAGGEPVTVSNETIEVLQKGIYYGELSGGVFDITIGKATDLWNFHDAEDAETETEDESVASKVPDADELAEAMKHVDYTKIKIDGNTVTLEDPDMEIDLGGIAKGYIADRVTAYLEGEGVVSAVVDLGGNIVTIGGKSDTLIVAADDEASAEQTPFNVGIKDPQSETGELIGIVPAADKTVVTSGTYERYFIEDGVKYHHILNSETGYPTDTDVLSATIISDKGASVDCDGLSTTCLALGVDKALELIENIDGVETIIVDSDGEIHISSDDIGFTAY